MNYASLHLLKKKYMRVRKQLSYKQQKIRKNNSDKKRINSKKKTARKLPCSDQPSKKEKIGNEKQST